MYLDKNFLDWVTKHNRNMLVAGAMTLFCPTTLVNSFFRNNQNKQIAWKQKNGCLTISFDCDFPNDVEAIPYMLKLLKKYSFKTTFACVGYWIEQYPDIHKMILDQGHEIMNHTYSHPDNELLNPERKFKDISEAEKKEEIERCHQVCKTLLHYEPIGCRIPHFKNLFTDEIYTILKELDYAYSSSTWLTNTNSYGLPFWTKDGIIEFPLTTCPKHPFTVFDTWHSFNSPRLLHKIVHRTEDAYLHLAKFLVDAAIKFNSYINIYIDPRDVLILKRFEELLIYIKDREEHLWVANYQDILSNIRQTRGIEHAQV
jgi:hypothetical protein